jgi:ribosomal protein S12 methylthiotransferase accessory factor YcaO
MSGSYLRWRVRGLAGGHESGIVTHMSMTVDQVVEETKRWPEEQVAALFERFLLSNYRLPDAAVDAEWAAEMKRRIDDIESGREGGIPGEEVAARVRKIVGL